MTDIERLIELLGNLSISCEEKIGCINCEYNKETCCKLKRKADYLLKNGVIVPPCKVGDKVYCIRTWPSGRKTIHPFGAPDWDWIMEHLNDFGKTVFLTREEAEKALAERQTP